jgi:hypothetical protein
LLCRSLFRRRESIEFAGAVGAEPAIAFGLAGPARARPTKAERRPLVGDDIGLGRPLRAHHHQSGASRLVKAPINNDNNNGNSNQRRQQQ